MITQQNEFFVRLFLLMLKGGTVVLKQLFMKMLADRGSQLDGFLQVNKEEIKKLKEDKVLTLKQYNMLFPNNGKIDICKWDISLLSCLLLNIVDVSVKTDKKAIESIRKLRNEYVAHHPDGSIDAKTFFNKWNNLNTSIMNLANGLNYEERSELVEITKCVGEDPLDIEHVMEYIKDMDEINQVLEHTIQQIEQLSLTVQQQQEGTQTDIENIKEQLRQCISNDKQDISTVIIGEITVSGRDPKAVTTAAAMLIAHAKKSKELTCRLSGVQNDRGQGVINTVFSFFDRVKYYCCKPDISTDGQTTSQKSVTALVQEIHNAGGEVIDVTEGSVLLHIQCHSVPGVLTVFDYFQSTEIKQRLNEIAACLNEQIRFPVSLTACIQVQSLRKALHLMQEKQNQVFTKSVRLVMKCRNPEDVLNVTNIFDERDASAEITALSECLSNEVGSQVTLKASIETDTLHKYELVSGTYDLGQEDTEQGISRLESHKEKEVSGSQSEVLTDEKSVTSFGEKTELVPGQCYDDAIKLLQLGENQYEFVAFLFYSDKDKFVSDLVKDELDRALHILTGIDRDLICTAKKYFTQGSYICFEFMRCLKRSSSVIVIESVHLDEWHSAMLEDAHKLGKQIVPIAFEDDDKQVPFLKGLANSSNLRLVLKKENETYTLNSTWKEVGTSIIKLIATQGKIVVNAQKSSSMGQSAGRVSGIMKITEAVSTIPEGTRQPLKENAKVETDDCPVPLQAAILPEMLRSLSKRRSEKNEEEEQMFHDPVPEQEITEQNKESDTSLLLDLTNRSWDDCDIRVRFKTSASHGYKQAPRPEYGLASRAATFPVLGMNGGLLESDYCVYYPDVSPGGHTRNATASIKTATSKVYSYARLKVSNFDLPKDVDRDQLEKHLAKGEFEDIFNMTVEEFRQLPELKRNDLKRKTDLY